MCFGGSDNTTSTNTTTQTLPSWITGPASQLISDAQQITSKPYQPYTGQRVAGFTDNQNQAISGIAGLQGQWQPYIQNANSALGNAAGTVGGNYQAPSYSAQSVTPGTVSSANFDDAAAKQYMSPYTQNVINTSLDEMNRNERMQENQNNATAARQGAFGGSRANILNAETQRNNNMLANQMIANLNNTGYQNAQQQFNADQNRGLAANEFNQNNSLQGQLYNSQADFQRQQANDKALQAQAGFNQNDLNRQLQVAQGYGNLGVADQNLGLTGLNAQYNAGAQQQNLNQQNLNTAYNDFLAQRQWPYQQAGFMSDIIRGSPYPGSSTQVTQQPDNTLQSVAGLGLSGLGLLGGTGAFGSGGWMTKWFS